MVAQTNTENASTIKLGFATVTLLENNIINSHILIKDSVTAQQVKLILDAYLKLGEGKKRPHLITATKFVIMEKEAMEFISTEANKFGIADAFVIRSLPQKIIGNFYLKFHKPKIPTKLFTSKEKAITWLKTF